MAASKIADFYGRAEGNIAHIADAEQAYVQAGMTGAPTCICLPEEERPPWWKEISKYAKTSLSDC